jgi:hypothetical protein
MSFGDLFLRVIGSETTMSSTIYDIEGSHCHHAYAMMVMIFEAKRCVTWWRGALKDKKMKFACTSSGRDNDVIKMFA